MFTREFDSYSYGYPNSVVKIQKILMWSIMNLEGSKYTAKDKNQKSINYANDFPTLAELMKEQKESSNESNAVHYRRDLDSIG